LRVTFTDAQLRQLREITQDRTAPKRDWQKTILFAIAVAGSLFGVASYLFVTRADYAQTTAQLQLFANTLEATQVAQSELSESQEKLNDKIEQHHRAVPR